MNRSPYTGLPNDDRRIAEELQAMGAFDGQPHTPSRLEQSLASLAELLTWLRWKGEIAAYGCRIGVSRPHQAHTLA